MIISNELIVDIAHEVANKIKMNVKLRIESKYFDDNLFYPINLCPNIDELRRTRDERSAFKFICKQEYAMLKGKAISCINFWWPTITKSKEQVSINANYRLEFLNHIISKYS